jgi:hypothetical protein
MKLSRVIKKKLDNKLVEKELLNEQIIGAALKTKLIESRKPFNPRGNSIEVFTEWE